MEYDLNFGNAVFEYKDQDILCLISLEADSTEEATKKAVEWLGNEKSVSLTLVKYERRENN